MQAIKYKWNLAEKEPFLFLAGGKKMRLLGQDVDFAIGNRTCIGHFKDGKHVKCPDNRPVDHDWYCNSCRINDDFFLCVQCDGSGCANKKQRSSCSDNSYYVYLAAFDSILKVGISHERRILERLVEQGADFGAKIACVQDGKNVRVIEQEISKSLNIVDRVHGVEKQKKIFGSPNIALANIGAAIKKLQSNGSGHLIPPEIYDLRSYYNLGSIPFNPGKFPLKEGAQLKGRIVAAKGSILVINSGNNYLSLNAHELIGRDLACN
jgi:hypothetical protein